MAMTPKSQSIFIVLLLLIIVSVQLSLCCLATKTTIDYYPFAEGTTLNYVKDKAYIPTKGKDLQSKTRNCAMLAKSLVKHLSHLKVSVVGVALVDVGTQQKPDVRAYFAPSGSAQVVDVKTVGKLLPEVDKEYPQWIVLNDANEQLSWRSRYTTRWKAPDHIPNQGSNGRISVQGVLVPASEVLIRDDNMPDTMQLIKSSEVTEWKRKAFGNSDTEFAIESRTDNDAESGPIIHKKWKVQDGKSTAFEKSHLVGTCALQKIVFGLFGQDRPEFGDAKRLYKDAHLSTAAPKLICAAEAVLAAKEITVLKKDGTRQPYESGQVVPSCVACQAVLPHLMSKSKPSDVRFQQLAKLKHLTSPAPAAALQPHTQ